MKTLYIVRHAKSSWEEIGLPDHDRPLNAAGVKKTKLVIDYLRNKNILPDLIISSTAKRAKDTAFQIAEGIGYPHSDIVLDKNIYHASAETIFDELYALPDKVESVMIFGHNPTLTYFVNQFLDPPIVNLPTTGMVALEFACNKWNEISSAKYRNRFTIFPKMLK